MATQQGKDLGEFGLAEVLVDRFPADAVSLARMDLEIELAARWTSSAARSVVRVFFRPL